MFLHPTLMQIASTPTNTSIKLLTKEVYTNARTVPSTHGGGLHGHLGLVMPDAAYTALAGVQFQLPVHPGPAPQHATSTNTASHAETTCLYDATLKELATATTVTEEIKKQILTAVDHIYLTTLDDDVFSFADISVDAMLTHLRNTYVTITRAELECNCTSIATIWTPDDPIKVLWEHLHEIQLISKAGNNPLSDTAIKDLTFTMFKNTGVFSTAYVKPATNQMLPKFHTHFTTKNKEHLRKLTTSQVGFHSTNAAISKSAKPSTIAASLPVPPVVPILLATPTTAAVVTNDGLHMFYCWTHGLGFNCNHTSTTCSKPSSGHNSSAMVKNMHGGKNTIMSNHRCPKPE